MRNITDIRARYLSDINLPSVSIIDIIEIILITFFVYQFMVWIKFTRAYTLLKGLLVIGAFLIIAYIFKMNTILWIVSKLASALITAIVVIFQPELRKVVEQLGQKKIMASIFPFDSGKEVKERFTDKTVNELIKACFDMAEVKTGALIVIELIFLYLLESVQYAEMRLPNQYENMITMTTLDYIEQQYKTATLTELCEKLHLPMHMLSKMIRKNTGFNFKELLQRKRLNKAVELMCETDLPISDIIAAVGYENGSYFHRVFKERYHTTPRAFRVANGKEERVRL